MNRVILMGRLVRDPETRYTQEGTAISRFTIAVDRIKRDEADFISCTAFGKNGEFAEKYLNKGTKIVLEGRWQTGSYKNKENQTVYTNDCVVDRMEFAESKKEESQNSQPNDFMTVPDSVADDLPFN